MKLLLVVLAAGLPVASLADDPIRFRDASEPAGVVDMGVNSTAPSFVDFDRDGDIDIYIPTEAHLDGQSNRLYENLGDGRFRDVAVARNADNGPSLSRGVAWGDYDNDGDDDLMISNMPPGRGQERVPSTLLKNLLSETGQPDFENVTRAAGIMRKDRLLDERYGGITVTGGGVAWGVFSSALSGAYALARRREVRSLEKGERRAPGRVGEPIGNRTWRRELYARLEAARSVRLGG